MSFIHRECYTAIRKDESTVDGCAIEVYVCACARSYVCVCVCVSVCMYVGRYVCMHSRNTILYLRALIMAAKLNVLKRTYVRAKCVHRECVPFCELNSLKTQSQLFSSSRDLQILHNLRNNELINSLSN